MASNPSDALIIWNPHSGGALATTEENSRPNRGRWALILDAFQNPSPGRTLDEIYSTLGKVLEKQANRAAYALGLGPQAVGRKIKVYFGDGEERVRQLELLHKSVPPKLEKHCLKLMKYTLPAESANVQYQAFKGIVELTTLFPGLRFIFLTTKCLKNTPSIEAVSALCERSAGPPDDEWAFWQMLAATCLTDTTISAMLEKNSVSDLTNCSEEGLSVIERLLVEHDSSGASKYSSAACIRYLGGVLDLPGFWVDMRGVRSDVTNRLCRALIRILKDIGVDDLTLGPTNESGPPFDDEGVDFLATRILTGISSWFGKLDQKDWSMQLWHESFRDLLWLLRMPRATELLPQSSAVATTTFEDILPTVNRSAQLSIFVDGENETEDTRNKIDNNSLADLHQQNDSMASIHNKIPDRDDSHSIGPPEEGDGDAKSHDSDIDSQQVPSQNEADNSSTSDDERYDPIGQLDDGGQTAYDAPDAADTVQTAHLYGDSSSQRDSLPLTPTVLPMAAEHSPLYRTIAEQVSAYIDIAVTDPVTNWAPPYTWEEYELPMEVLYDYDEPFPLPTGLDSILGLSEISDAHRITVEQVLGDLLHLPKYLGVVYHIKELRLAYRSRMNDLLFPWDITHSTPFVNNYLLLGRAEGALRRHRNNPHTPSNMMTVSESNWFMTRFDPDSANEKPLPSYIGGRVHARLVKAKARLNDIGFGHDLGLATAT